MSNISFSDSKELSIYPNPTSNLFTFNSEKVISKIEIFDVLGALMYTTNQKSETISIDFSSYAKGVYFVTVFNELGSISRKVVKQ